MTPLRITCTILNLLYINIAVLAQRGYFKEKEFINYLSYLQYWKKQEYSHYLKYPQCLHFLDLLQHETFRHELANAQCSKFIEEQQLLHWHLYTKKRMQQTQIAQKQIKKQSSSNNTSK
jgi:mediator of RNA polymerase II transcription subunit 31